MKSLKGKVFGIAAIGMLLSSNALASGVVTGCSAGVVTGIVNYIAAAFGVVTG